MHHLKTFTLTLVTAALLPTIGTAAPQTPGAPSQAAPHDPNNQAIAERGGGGGRGNFGGGHEGYNHGEVNRGDYYRRDNVNVYGVGGVGGVVAPVVVPGAGYYYPSNAETFPDDAEENRIYRENQGPREAL